MNRIYSKLLFNRYVKRYSDKLIPYLSNGTVNAGDFDIKLNINSPESFGRCCYDHSESRLVRDFAQEVTENDIVWNVGANIGVYSIVAAVIGADVHAFEPGEGARKELSSNCELNGVQVSIHSFALGDENTEMHLKTTGRTGNRGLTRDLDENAEMVPVRRGDGINIPRPDVMKIDVEGAEGIVLDGLGNILHNVRVCYIELHDGEYELAPPAHEVESRMEEYDFNITRPTSGKDIIKCVNKS